MNQQPLPEGHCFEKLKLGPAERAFCNKILSSDALAALVIDRLQNNRSCSVIRMSDGERAFMAYAQGGAQAGFMRDPAWLKRYGLEGVDQKKVGKDLLRAGMEADFLACTISGLFWNTFIVHPYFPRRTQFIDQFYPQLWRATGRVGAVLRSGPSLVLHREHATIVPVLQEQYKLANIDGRSLDSWRDHERLLVELKSHPAKLVLVSGGASGKSFCVALAKTAGKVVLDVGEAMQGCWVDSPKHDAAGRIIPDF